MTKLNALDTPKLDGAANDNFQGLLGLQSFSFVVDNKNFTCDYRIRKENSVPIDFSDLNIPQTQKILQAIVPLESNPGEVFVAEFGSMPGKTGEPLVKAIGTTMEKAIEIMESKLKIACIHHTDERVTNPRVKSQLIDIVDQMKCLELGEENRADSDWEKVASETYNAIFDAMHGNG